MLNQSRARKPLLFGAVAVLAVAVAAAWLPGPVSTDAAYVDTAHVASAGIGVEIPDTPPPPGPVVPVLDNTIAMPGVRYLDYFDELWATVDYNTVKTVRRDLSEVSDTMTVGSVGRIQGQGFPNALAPLSQMYLAQCSGANGTTPQLGVYSVRFHLGTPANTNGYTGICENKVESQVNLVYTLSHNPQQPTAPKTLSVQVAAGPWVGLVGLDAVTPTLPAGSLPLRDIATRWTKGGANMRDGLLLILGSDGANTAVYVWGPQNKELNSTYSYNGFVADAIDYGVGPNNEAYMHLMNTQTRELRVFDLRVSWQQPVLQTVLPYAPIGKVIKDAYGNSFLPASVGDPAGAKDGIVMVFDSAWQAKPLVRVPGQYNIYDAAEVELNKGVSPGIGIDKSNYLFLSGSAYGNPQAGSIVRFKLGN